MNIEQFTQEMSVETHVRVREKRPLNLSAFKPKIEKGWILVTLLESFQPYRQQSGICGGLSNTGTSFVRVFQFHLSILIPFTAPHSSIICVSYDGPNSGIRTKFQPNKRKTDIAAFFFFAFILIEIYVIIILLRAV
jgi:hypothetical protein